MTSTATDQTVQNSAGGAEISVRDLWKIYGHHPQRQLAALRSGEPGDAASTAAIRGVSFDVKPGETFVVMGLSGSGKSTLVRCLTRLIEPTDGSIQIDSVDVLGMSRRELSETRGKDWAMVFQHFGLLPHRRILQNVGYGLEVGGVPRRERESRARELIELVGLAGTEEKYPHELSGGMKQRVGLARALAVKPKLLLLDEPFSALDPLIRTDLQDQLLSLARLVNQTSIFITHDLSEALKVGDRIAIMRDGCFVQIGTPEEIVLQPADDYVRRFALEAPRAKVVSAGTACAPFPVLTGSESIDEALDVLVREERQAAVVQAASPFVVTLEQLQRGRSSGRSLSEVSDGRHATVDESTKLVELMPLLVSTGNPVIVRGPGGQLQGIVSNSAVVQALTVTETSDPITRRRLA